VIGNPFSGLLGYQFSWDTNKHKPAILGIGNPFSVSFGALTTVPTLEMTSSSTLGLHDSISECLLNNIM
jgi:hypothetical protein